MKEMYFILGWIGWIWLMLLLVVGGVAAWVQHQRRRGVAQHRGFEVVPKTQREVKPKDEE